MFIETLCYHFLEYSLLANWNLPFEVSENVKCLVQYQVFDLNVRVGDNIRNHWVRQINSLSFWKWLKIVDKELNCLQFDFYVVVVDQSNNLFLVLNIFRRYNTIQYDSIHSYFPNHNFCFTIFRDLQINGEMILI